MAGRRIIAALFAAITIAGCGGYQNSPKIDPKVELDERVKAAIKGLKEPSSLARGIAVGILEREAGTGNPNVKAAIPDLETVANGDKDPKVKEAAVKALAKIKGG